jgi:hypothetical protein
MPSESESESELFYDCRFTASQFSLATNLLRPTTSNFFQLNTCGVIPYATSSLMIGCVCRLKLLLVLASAVIHRSESRGTYDHISLSQTRDSPSWRARSSYVYPPGTGWPRYTPRHWVPFSSPPTTCRATVEVFDPTFTRGSVIPNDWTLLNRTNFQETRIYTTTSKSSCYSDFRCHETCLPNRCPAMDYSVYIRCSGNVCLASRWLAMDFHSGSTILIFRRHDTILTQFIKTVVHLFTPCEFSFPKRNAKLREHWITISVLQS